MNDSESQGVAGLPGNDEYTLPPLLPVYAATREPDDDPEDRRVWELSLLAHSVMVYGEEHDLSDTQRRNLTTAFDYKCGVVEDIIERSLLESPIPDSYRLDHHKRYLDVSRRLVEAVEDSLRSRSVDLDSVIRLHREYMELLSQQTFFMTLKLEKLKAEITKRQAEAEQPDSFRNYIDGLAAGLVVGAERRAVITDQTLSSEPVGTQVATQGNDDEKNVEPKTATSRDRPSLDELPDDATFSPKALADLSGIDYEILRKRLERLRKSRDDCFIEVTERKGNEPQYLYKIGPVRPLIRELQGNRPVSRSASRSCPPLE